MTEEITSGLEGRVKELTEVTQREKNIKNIRYGYKIWWLAWDGLKQYDNSFRRKKKKA